MLPGNPKKNVSGGWDPNTGGIDVVFRLKHERVESFWKKFDEMMKAIESG
jgi:hypothetical protein